MRARRTTMADIEKARKLFNEAGLGFPILPLKSLH